MICFHPIPIDGFLVPCMRCGGCLARRSVDWSNRLCWEADYWQSACFVTLTYSDEALPNDLSVSKRTLQDFFKRLRKIVHPRKFRYFACGEYGEDRGRPHYHFCAFGLGVSDERAIGHAWRVDGVQQGFVEVSEFLRERARYVAGYLLKEVSPDINLLGRAKPFALMSKKMGLSYALANEAKIRDGLVTIGGKPVSIPRYFRKVLGIVTHRTDNALSDLLLHHFPRVDRTLEPDAYNLSGELVAKTPRFYRALQSGKASRMQAEVDFKAKQALSGRRLNGL